jgi:hypothetical protein
VEQDFLDNKGVVSTGCVHSTTLGFDHIGEGALGFNVWVVRDATDATCGMQADGEPMQKVVAQNGGSSSPLSPQALFRDGRVYKNEVALR